VTASFTPSDIFQRFQDSLFSPTLFVHEAVQSVCGRPSDWPSARDVEAVLDSQGEETVTLTTHPIAAPFIPYKRQIDPMFYADSYEKCAFALAERYFSVKQGEFYGLIPILDEEINRRLLDFGARQFNPLVNHLEGNIMGYPEKYAVLQTYANDPRVETICEIGFNTGYSALFMALQNSKARFIEFDIFYHNYTALALSALQELLPNRDILGIGGDSSISVTRFHRMFPEIRCNLLFIDGGHSTRSIRSDLESMSILANRSYHRVLVDDTPYGNNIFEEYQRFVTVNQSEDSSRSMYRDIQSSKLESSETESQSQSQSQGSSSESEEQTMQRRAKLRHIQHFFMNASSQPCFSWELKAFQNPLHNFVTLTDAEHCVPGQTSQFYDVPSGISVAEYLFD
jgi:hypothetical protein